MSVRERERERERENNNNIGLQTLSYKFIPNCSSNDSLLNDVFVSGWYEGSPLTCVCVCVCLNTCMCMYKCLFAIASQPKFI